MVVVILGLLCTSGLGCQRPPAAPTPGSVVVYDVSLKAQTPAELPPSCVSGTTAAVVSPPSLWSCIARKWIEIPCSTLVGGAVAYASATNTLLACSAGQWTVIALPDAGPPGEPGAPGAPGSQGDAGATSLIQLTTEAPGDRCPAGGQRVDVGLDRDGNGVLAPGEIKQTAYICNGSVAPDAGDAGMTADAAVTDGPGPDQGGDGLPASDAGEAVPMACSDPSRRRCART